MGFIFVGVFAPYITNYDPLMPDLLSRLTPPSREHILGTDTLGRDLAARVAYGARTSLLIALFTMIAGGGAGLILGLVSGYFGGLPDAIILRFIEWFFALPTILFGLLLAATMGPSMTTVIIALAINIWARFARIIRGDVLAIKQREFIAQARVAGCSHLRILILHILPNVLSTFMVLLSLNVGWALIAAASLSFLGAGVPPPTPDWGAIVASGRDYISSAWWISIVPGLVLSLLVFALNTFGDWVRDMLDPRIRARL